MHRLFVLLAVVVLLGGCGLHKDQRVDPAPVTDPTLELVTVRFEVSAAADGVTVEIEDALRAASVPVEGLFGGVRPIVADGSYGVGRRAEYSEFELFLRNEGSSAVYSPKLTVVEFLTRNRKASARGKITTSDNGLPGVGATFDYGWLLDNEERLPVGADTPVRRWRIEDPERGFEPYILVLELTYFVAATEPDLPPVPDGVVADFRAEVDPSTGRVELTDLRSPYLNVAVLGSAAYVPEAEWLEVELELTAVVDDVFLDALAVTFDGLRLVSNDPHRTVVHDSKGGATAAKQGVGALGPGSSITLRLPFRGVSTSDMTSPATLGKFTFRARISGAVDPIVGGATASAVASRGVTTRLELPGVASAYIVDDAGLGALAGQTTLKLRPARSEVLAGRLSAFDVAASGPIVEYSVVDPTSISQFATLNMRVTPELKAAYDSGARLEVLEFVSMRSPASIYWRSLPTWALPADVAAGWVSAPIYPGNLNFERNNQERFAYYVLVATADKHRASTLSSQASSTPQERNPFLLGPTETYRLRETVPLPEGELEFIPSLLNPINPEVKMSQTVECNTPEAIRLGLNNGGCSNDEVGYQDPPRTNPHMGMDLRAWRGTKIYAAADGTVRFADYVSNTSQVYGCTVIVTHDNGYETLYAHLDAPRLSDGTYNCSFPVSEGERVTAGSTVLGKSGGSTAPSEPEYDAHLHFSISPMPFDLVTPNNSIFVSPRGICDQRNNVPNGVLGLEAMLFLSVPNGDERKIIGLTGGSFTEVNDEGRGRCARQQVDIAADIDRDELLGYIGSDYSRTLSYLAIDYQWWGLSKLSGTFKPHPQRDPRRLFADSISAVGVTGLAAEVVTLDDNAVVEGYGFGQLGPSGAVRVLFHSAGRLGASARPELEGEFVAAAATSVTSGVPGPSERVSGNAAWGAVGVVFENGRNRTYEESGAQLQIAPVVESVLVIDGVTPYRARGGKTIQVAGHGFLSGPAGERSFEGSIGTHPAQPQFAATEPPSPLAFALVVANELFSGPATISARVDSLEDLDIGGVTIYPYITSSPPNGYSGQAAVVTGTNLGPDVVVRLNGGNITVPGTGTSAAFIVPDGIRSGALSVTAAGQASGNGRRFLALPTIEVVTVDAASGEPLGAGIFLTAEALDDASRGAYDETSSAISTSASDEYKLAGTGVWTIEARADGYEAATITRDLTTTPVTVELGLAPVPAVEAHP